MIAVPVAIAYSFAFTQGAGFDESLFQWLTVISIAATATWQLGVGALLATVALAVAKSLGNRPLFTEGDDEHS